MTDPAWENTSDDWAGATCEMATAPVQLSLDLDVDDDTGRNLPDAELDRLCDAMMTVGSSSRATGAPTFDGAREA